MKKLIAYLCFMLLSIYVSGQESSAITCADGLDNDNDGLIDCEDTDCLEFSADGCEICQFDATSFVDVVLDYQPQCSNLNYDEPGQAIGLSNWQLPTDGKAVLLGEGGMIELGFTNNVLINSGDNTADLWIFEIGDLAEDCDIALHPYDVNTTTILQNNGLNDPDGDGYYDFGQIGGERFYIDIDEVLIGYPPATLIFDAIKITDVPDLDCFSTINPGADIDAVCAVQSATLDCAGIPNGNAILNSCNLCLSLDDPTFYEECKDGIYIPNAFSPNEDGKNDTFKIYLASETQAEVLDYAIYNRWGALVYKAANFDIHTATHWWDGKINNSIAPNGWYVYMIKIEYADGKVEVLRGGVGKM